MPRNLFEGKPKEWLMSLGSVGKVGANAVIDTLGAMVPTNTRVFRDAQGNLINLDTGERMNPPEEIPVQQKDTFNPNWQRPLTIEEKMNLQFGQPPQWLMNAGDKAFTGMQKGAQIVQNPIEELNRFMR